MIRMMQIRALVLVFGMVFICTADRRTHPIRERATRPVTLRSHHLVQRAPWNQHGGKDCCTINQPCRNGGTCIVNDYGLTECVCPEKYTGPVCNIDCTEKKEICPDGFEMIPPGSGKCYHICSAEDTGNFWQAQKHCRDLHAKTSLWEPESDDELRYVTDKLDGSCSYWTGIFDVHKEGKPIFVGTGKQFSLNEISGGNKEKGDCVKINNFSSKWKFKYDLCANSRRCICEIVNPCDLPDDPVLPVPRDPMYG